MNGWDPEEMIRSWSSERGKGKEMAYAEGFRVVTLVSDADWEKLTGQVDTSGDKALEIERE